jgi:hypothetical protein
MTATGYVADAIYRLIVWSFWQPFSLAPLCGFPKFVDLLISSQRASDDQSHARPQLSLSGVPVWVLVRQLSSWAGYL